MSAEDPLHRVRQRGRALVSAAEPLLMELRRMTAERDAALLKADLLRKQLDECNERITEYRLRLRKEAPR